MERAGADSTGTGRDRTVAVAEPPPTSGAHWASRDEDTPYRRPAGAAVPFRRPPAQNSFPAAGPDDATAVDAGPAAGDGRPASGPRRGDGPSFDAFGPAARRAPAPGTGGAGSPREAGPDAPTRPLPPPGTPPRRRGGSSRASFGMSDGPIGGGRAQGADPSAPGSATPGPAAGPSPAGPAAARPDLGDTPGQRWPTSQFPPGPPPFGRGARPASAGHAEPAAASRDTGATRAAPDPAGSGPDHTAAHRAAAPERPGPFPPSFIPPGPGTPGPGMSGPGTPGPGASGPGAPGPGTPGPDTLRPDTLRPDTLRPDTVRLDTVRLDTLRLGAPPDPYAPDRLPGPTDPERPAPRHPAAPERPGPDLFPPRSDRGAAGPAAVVPAGAEPEIVSGFARPGDDAGAHGVGDLAGPGREIRPHRAARGAPAAPAAPRRGRRIVSAALGLAVTLGAGYGVVYYADGDHRLPAVLRLGAEREEPAAAPVAAAPLNGRTAAELDVVAGPMKVTVRTEDLGDQLYRLAAGPDSGTTPTAVVDGDRVRVHAAPDGDGVADSVEIVLSTRVRWALRFSGGAQEQVLDLGGGQVSRVDLAGAARRVELNLPAAAGRVPVRVTGAVEELAVTSPAGNPVRVSVDSGAKTVAAGERTLRDVKPGSTLTPRGWNTRDRYDLAAATRLTLLSVRTG